MKTYTTAIAPYVEREFALAAAAEREGNQQQAFVHLERAHVLGQTSTFHHVRVHWQMFKWGWRQRRLSECLGQIIRIVGAATKTALGWIPSGNTGGTNISPFKRLPVASDLDFIIKSVRASRD